MRPDAYPTDHDRNAVWVKVMRDVRRRRGPNARWSSGKVEIRLKAPMFSDEMWRILARSLGWSHRESEIVPALLDDRKGTAIAAHLGISRHTVHTHTERLYRKMGITSRVELVRRIFVEYLRVSGSGRSRYGARSTGITRATSGGSHRAPDSTQR